ncbi:MAG: hypothetical protein RMM17_07925 [Acidobacteriota bacterium]|nr:hypothetical protein [Blastocatellia bacterium]MDW8412592.1 hypothetical protein [Acidobacteriota bacterium]
MFFRLFCVLTIALVFAGCGDDVSSSVKQPEIQTVTTAQGSDKSQLDKTSEVQPNKNSSQPSTAQSSEPKTKPEAQKPAKSPMERFLEYLVRKEGFEVEVATFIPKGSFNAEDIIQFKILEPKAAVIVLKFPTEFHKEYSLPQFQMLSQDGRRIISEGLYAAAIKSDDDMIDKAIKDALIEFQSQ